MKLGSCVIKCIFQKNRVSSEKEPKRGSRGQLKVVRESVTETVTAEQRREGLKGVSQMDIQGENCLGRQNSP